MVFHSAMNCPLLQCSPWYCTLFLTAFLSAYMEDEMCCALIDRDWDEYEVEWGGGGEDLGVVVRLV